MEEEEEENHNDVGVNSRFAISIHNLTLHAQI